MTEPVAWTDDEIIAKVREFAEANGLPPPVPVEAADEFEAAVGHPLPLLLRRIYCEVANGGFGVRGDVVSLVEAGTWHRFSDADSLGWLHRGWSSAYEGVHPAHVVPLVTMGCGIWWCIDLSTPQGDMWGIDPNALCDRHFLFPERFTLAEWLTDWLEGNDAFPEAPPLDCSNC
ncbi:hypothetical protein [Kitasatospora saccharophila]